MAMPAELRARTNQPEFAGGGDSRDLLTQEQNKVYALLQNAMTQEGGVYTLTFNISYLGVPVIALATVKASENGNTVKRKFHVVNGTSVTIAGRLLDVRVQDVTPVLLPFSGEPTPGAGSKYTVSVVVQRGTRASDNFPTLWDSVTSLTDSGGATPLVVIPIPQEAGVISAEVCALSAATPPGPSEVVVQFIGGGTGIFKSYRVIDKPGFVAVPPGATEIAISNSDATNATIITLTWGIDG
jgi:hypothetical protein